MSSDTLTDMSLVAHPREIDSTTTSTSSSAITDAEEELITPHAAALLRSGSPRVTEPQDTATSASAASDTAVATQAVPQDAATTAPTQPTATGGKKTTPGKSFYSSYRTFQRNGTEAPIATFAETLGADGQTATRQGRLNEEGKWDMKQSTNPATGADWDTTVADIQKRWTDIHANTFLRRPHRGLVDLESAFFEPFGRASSTLGPRIPLLLGGPSLAHTIFNDDFFGSMMPRSLFSPSTLMPPLRGLRRSARPAVGQRAVDEDTKAPAPSAIESATTVPMITAA